MQGIMKGLVMTMMIFGGVFCGEWLPTLDLKLAMSATNRLKFTHFEKTHLLKHHTADEERYGEKYKNEYTRK